MSVPPFAWIEAARSSRAGLSTGGQWAGPAGRRKVPSIRKVVSAMRGGGCRSSPPPDSAHRTHGLIRRYPVTVRQVGDLGEVAHVEFAHLVALVRQPSQLRSGSSKDFSVFSGPLADPQQRFNSRCRVDLRQFSYCLTSLLGASSSVQDDLRQVSPRCRHDGTLKILLMRSATASVTGCGRWTV